MQTVNKKHAKAIREAVQHTGHYTEADEIVINQAALILTMIDQAQKEVTQFIQVFPTGAEQISPQVNNLRGLIADFQKIAMQLGLTPAARRKLGIEPVRTEKPKSSLMALRKAK